MTSRIESDMDAEVSDRFPNNTTGEISFADLQSVLGDMVDSCFRADAYMPEIGTGRFLKESGDGYLIIEDPSPYPDIISKMQGFIPMSEFSDGTVSVDRADLHSGIDYIESPGNMESRTIDSGDSVDVDSNNYLSNGTGDMTVLLPAGSDWEILFPVVFDSVAGTPVMMNKANGVSTLAGNNDWLIQLSAAKVAYQPVTSGGAYAALVLGTTVLTTGVEYIISVRNESDTVTVSVDDSDEISTDLSGSGFNNVGNLLKIGVFGSTTGMDGAIGQVLILDDPLTSGERTAYINGGDLPTYAQLLAVSS